MLTRKEAKTKVCPYTYVMLSGICNTRGTKEEAQRIGESISSVMNCTAENCPKWKDEFLNDNPCYFSHDYIECAKFKEEIVFHAQKVHSTYPETIDYWKTYHKACLTCDQHFGRCGE